MKKAIFLDIFVILKDNSLYRKVSDIAYKVDLKNGSPFIENVAKEGVILYDDGTFARICESIVKKSKRPLFAAKSLLEKNLLEEYFKSLLCYVPCGSSNSIRKGLESKKLCWR
jgi:hypothetical protein